MRRRLIFLVLTAAVLSTLTAPAAKAVTNVADPVRIAISALKIDAKIEARGTTGAGFMLPPDSAWDVAWHMHSVRPGAPGNSVMYGHLNTRSSRVAVFTNLHRLRVGNTVRVTDRRGTVRIFKVKKVGVYQRDQLPLHEISGKTSAVRLNLYTCAGSWNRRLGDYSHRLVVFTTLVSVQTAALGR